MSNARQSNQEIVIAKRLLMNKSNSFHLSELENNLPQKLGNRSHKDNHYCKIRCYRETFPIKKIAACKCFQRT